MRTTFEINDELLNEVIKTSGAKTKKGAIVVALKEYLKTKRRQELKDIIGKYEEFTLSLKDLEKMRDEG